MYTVEEIKVKVSSEPVWAARALEALFDRQTAVEQTALATHELNYRGFNAVDAEILSSFAIQVKRGRILSVKQLAIAYKKLPKYARQLWAIAYGEIS